ncbi:MAG: mandelate racemase/muconate lactonizing enzyme family protein [Beijerinckiaceae bacterium]
MFVTEGKVHVLDIPLRRRFHWAAHSEERIDVVLFELRASNGARGVAEMTVRTKWHGETVQDVVGALAVLPSALQAVDLTSAEMFYGAMRRATKSPLARAIVDMARTDMLAQSDNLTLPQAVARMFLPGAGVEEVASSAAFSCTITRSQPDRMAREAAHYVETIGARAFKIKTGQGLEADAQAVASIRKVAGKTAVLSADSNRAGPPERVADMAAMLAENAVEWFEDPCHFAADETFVRVRRESCVPVLVDNACRSLPAARSFLDLGAEGLSVKVMKAGIGESLEITRAAQEAGASITVGICASTALSACYSLALFAALPACLRAMPCEETFFLNLDGDILREPLVFAGGEIGLPPPGPMADRIDWAVVSKYSVARHIAG